MKTALTSGHSQQDVCRPPRPYPALPSDIVLHHTQWARSSFFNGDDNTENFLDDLSAPNSDEESDHVSSTHSPTQANQEHDQDASFFDASAASKHESSLSDNPIMAELVRIMIARFEHLVERGFLNPEFLQRIRNDPQEILRFIRQNRAVVGDHLNRRLDPSMRPSPAKLEEQGIVPKGYFTNGPGAHDQAMTGKHRRRRSVSMSTAPKKEERQSTAHADDHKEEHAVRNQKATAKVRRESFAGPGFAMPHIHGQDPGMSEEDEDYHAQQGQGQGQRQGWHKKKAKHSHDI